MQIIICLVCLYDTGYQPQTGDFRLISCQETQSAGADEIVSRLSVSALSVQKQEVDADAQLCCTSIGLKIQ